MSYDKIKYELLFVAFTNYRLPLPSILKISSDNDMEIENPLEHEGRIRSFPHERGNWATYAYIPCA